MSFTQIIAAVFLAAAPMEISFDDLEHISSEAHAVRLRGFAYQTQEGQWILSSDAHLKSCCVGSAAKAKQQVFLSGFAGPLPSGQVVVVEGSWRVLADQPAGYYALEDAHLVRGETFPWLTAAMGFMVLAGGGYAIFTRRTLKK